MNCTRKSQIAPPNVIEIANESVYGTHSRMLSKLDFRVQMDAKSTQLKNESKSELFSAPAHVQDSAKRKTINAFEVRLMVQFRVHLTMHLELYPKVHFKIYIKRHKKGELDNALKGALQVALKLHVLLQLSMHKSIPNDSIKGEFEDASKISFYGAHKTA